MVVAPIFTQVHQWHLQASGAAAAWAEAPGLGASVTVAVLDTGVSPTPSLPASAILPGYDFISHDTDASDDHGHGTMMATIIAGRGAMSDVA